jgi:hypothetical protein
MISFNQWHGTLSFLTSNYRKRVTHKLEVICHIILIFMLIHFQVLAKKNYFQAYTFIDMWIQTTYPVIISKANQSLQNPYHAISYMLCLQDNMGSRHLNGRFEFCLLFTLMILITWHLSYINKKGCPDRGPDKKKPIKYDVVDNSA